MKKILFIVVIGVLCFALVACTSTATPAESSTSVAEETTSAAETAAATTAAEGGEKADSDIFIGMIMQDMSSQMPGMIAAAAEDYVAANFPDIKLSMLDAEGDVVKETEQIQSLASQGADCIVVNPMESDSLTATIQSVIESGTPIILIGANLTEDVGQYWCGSPDIESGKIQGQWAADVLNGAGNVAIISGHLGHQAEVDRHAGAFEIFEKYPDIKVVYDQTGDWDPAIAMSLMENWLELDEEIDAVIAQNDDMAMGALSAIEAAGLKDKIKVIGCDATDEALQAIVDGRLDATVFQDAIGQGEGVIQMAYEIAKGGDPDDVSIAYKLIDASNIDDYKFLLED